MEDYKDGDYDWETSVATSSSKYSKLGCLPLLSNTIEKQKLPVEDKQDDDLKSLSTKVQVLEEKEAICDSELPPSLAEDILSLREDFPWKIKDFSMIDQTDRQEDRGKAFSASLKKFKTFGMEENIGNERQLCSHYSELDPDTKNKPVLRAVEEKGLQNPETSNDKKLKAFFALHDKMLVSVNDKGSHKGNTVTASEFQEAVSELGIGEKVLFLKPNSVHSKLSKPLNTEINGDETLDNQSGNSKFSFLPSHKLALKHSAVPLPANPFQAVSKPVKAMEIEITNKQIPGKCIEPEPPDITGHTCSKELNKALQAMLERRSGEPDKQKTSQVRYHPYLRTETNYQTTLPKLEEFQ